MESNKHVVCCFEGKNAEDVEELIAREIESLQDGWGWNPIVIHQSISISSFYSEGHFKHIVALITFANGDDIQ